MVRTTSQPQNENVTNAYVQFKSLGVNWASTLLGCVAVLMVPLPIIIYVYGPAIRAKSKFATVHTALDKDELDD